MLKIGVLALQGAVAEHIRTINKAGAEGVAVKKPQQLEELAGLIIPGGESTTIGKLMRLYHFIEPIQRKVTEENFPVFGTCAGMIILAKKIEGTEEPHLGLMNISVQRNAFGRQRESFETDLAIKDIAEDYRAVFIRAPLITQVDETVSVLAEHNGQIVAAQEKNLLAASFHPELTDDVRLHQHFIHMAQTYKE